MEAYGAVMRWLRRPLSDEPLEQTHAVTVQLLCVAAIVLLTAIEVGRFFTATASVTPEYLLESGFDAALGLGAALAWRAVRRGSVSNALAWLIGPVLAMWSAAAGMLGLGFTLDFMRAIPPLVAIAALVMGRRALWASLSLLAMGMALGRARDLGVFGPPPDIAPHVPPLGAAGQTLAGIVFLALVLDRFGVALRDAFLAATARGKELERISTALADETENRLRAQAALAGAQRLEAIGRLAAGVAHDFNNLVMVISGATELARLRSSDPVLVSRNLDTIADATRQAEHLTRQLLTLARRQLVSPRVVSVDDVMTRVLPLLRRVAGSDITIDCRLAASSASVRIDPVQIEQLVLNLVSNSRDAMPRGGVLQISTDLARLEPHGPEHVRLRVIDDGLGMDEATRARVFEPFFTTKPNGTGIGLAACVEIVTQAGGKLGVDSRPGQGTTVTAWFPSVAEAPAVESARARGHGETVLVADDEAPLRRQLVQGLSQLGYRVIEADSANAALAAARAEQQVLRVVVTDLHMPGGIAGHELIEQVRGDLPGVKFVLMSGDVSALEQLKTRGLKDTLTVAKPISIAALGERVAALIAERR